MSTLPPGARILAEFETLLKSLQGKTVGEARKLAHSGLLEILERHGVVEPVRSQLAGKMIARIKQFQKPAGPSN